MPTVPVIDQNMQSTPDVQAPNVSTMQNFAPQEMEKAGATMQQSGLRQMAVGQAVALRIQEQLDNANVKAGENQFIQSATDVLHGDNGYMLKRGADAINGYDQASQAIVKSKQDVLESLNNDVQKHMFDRVSQQHLVTLGAQMSQHRAQQRVEYSSTQASSRADAMRSMAQNADIGSADQDKYIETGVQEIQQALSFKGVPADSDEALKAERAYRSQITQDNVSRLMEDGKYTQAGELLTKEQQAGHVEADTGDRLRRAIRGNLQRTENIQQAEDILAPYQNKQLRIEDIPAMLDKTKDIANPEQRHLVQDMVLTKAHQQLSLQNQLYDENRNDIANYKAKNGTLDGVDPVKFGKLNDVDQAEMMRPPAIETDLNTWYNFVTKPDSLTLDNVNNAYARGLLSKSSFMSFTEKAMSQQKQTDYVQEANAVNDRINYFANKAGMNIYTTQSADDKIAHGQLTYAVNNEIDRVKAQSKEHKITSDQVDQIIKRELTQQTLNTPRSPYNPLSIIGFPMKKDQKFTFQMPNGATMVVPGSDGKMHYSDGKQDLGTVE